MRMSSQSHRNFDDSTRGSVVDVTATFAGVLLIVAAGFDMLQGVAAIANDDLYAAGTEYLYKLDMTVWGTVHLVIGLLSLVVAIGILRRTGWGQVSGMIIAGLAMLTNFAALPLYPFWSIVVIAFYGLVIWALSVQLGDQP
jgi:hypothetical protein